MKNLGSFLILLLMSILVISCNDESDNNSAEGTSRIRVKMTDAPGDYDEVNVEVIGVRIKNSLDTNDENWVDLPNVNPTIVNLLDLTGGVTLLLADTEIPSGFLGQIRLILGDENTIVVDGETHVLNTPSAQQSGLKVKIDQTLQPNMTYNFLLDFDVDESVVSAGNSGNYNLKPVIRVTADEASGSISGSILPLGVPFVASVNVGSTVVSANTNAAGEFQIHGVPAGTYSVTLTPSVESGLSPLVVDNVVVVNGQATLMGNLSL